MEYVPGRVFTDPALTKLPKAERTAWYDVYAIHFTQRGAY